MFDWVLNTHLLFQIYCQYDYAIKLLANELSDLDLQKQLLEMFHKISCS